MLRFLLAVLAVALVTADAAEAGTTIVRSEQAFQNAVADKRARGGVIVVARGTYDRLVVGRRPARAGRLIIRGRPGVTVRLMELVRTHRVTVVGVRVTPGVFRDSRIDVRGSRQILIRGVRVVGTDRRFARVRLRASRRVTVTRSDFTGCGVRLACLKLDGRNRDIRVAGNSFHDCVGCDFVRGRFAARLTVRNNTFRDALAGGCVTLKGCNHQDLVQLDGGRDLLVEGNTFGVYEFGAAQLFIRSGDHATIRGNMFEAADPGPLGLASLNAIVLGTHLGWAPRHVLIESNEILAGGVRPDFYLPPGVATSVLLWPAFDLLPTEERPVVRGNTIGVVESAEWFCLRLGESSGNRVLRGFACSDADTTDG